MKLFFVVALAALALAGFKGCEEKGSAPESDAMAYCQTHYKDADACKADTKCWWNAGKAKCSEAKEGTH